jgi:hypothetical protein
MITCRQMVELLLDFLEDALSPDCCEQIREHLRCCPPCVTFVETYRVTITLSRRLTPTPLPADLERRLRAAIEKCRRQEP